MPEGETGRAILEKYLDREAWEDAYAGRTSVLRRISRYSGLDFEKIMDLPYSYFLLLNKESWIESWMQTENGRDFLKALWRLQQTEADIEAVHRFQNREAR